MMLQKRKRVNFEKQTYSLFLLNLSNLILIYFLIFLDNHLRNALLIAMGWQQTLGIFKNLIFEIY